MTIDRSRELPLSEGISIAESIISLLPTSTVSVAGSIRRRRPIVGDIDLVVSQDTPRAIDGCRWVRGGDRFRSYILDDAIQVNLFLADAAEWQSMMLTATGSGRFNQLMRSIAKHQGLLLNQYGLWRDGSLVTRASEEAIFDALGLTYVPPESREVEGEASLGYCIGSTGKVYRITSHGVNIMCECPGFTYHGYCYHAAAAEAEVDMTGAPSRVPPAMKLNIGAVSMLRVKRGYMRVLKGGGR
jgi:hypothetical protein